MAPSKAKLSSQVRTSVELMAPSEVELRRLGEPSSLFDGFCGGV